LQQLLKVQSALVDRRHLIETMRRLYSGNVEHLDKLTEFEHCYQPCDSLQHILDQSFVHQLLLRSSHESNVDLLFALRFFLQDIEQALETCPPLIEPLFRAQFFTYEQFETILQLGSGNLFRFSTLFVVTADEHRARDVLRAQGSMNNDNLYCVLFQIKASGMAREYKSIIVFPLLTQFRVCTIKLERCVLIVTLEPVHQRTAASSRSTDGQLGPIEFAHQLRRRARFDQAQTIFERLLAQYPVHADQCHYGLARIAQDRGLYEISREHYVKASEKCSRKNRAYYFHHLAVVSDSLHDYEAALTLYKKALSTMRDKLSRAICLNNMGVTLANTSQWAEALECFQQSAMIQAKHLWSEHSCVYITYANIGALHFCIGRLDCALDFYQCAASLLSARSPSIVQAAVYVNLAEALREKKEVNGALTFFCKAAKLVRQVPCGDYPDLDFINENIERLQDADGLVR
jgi:tetratricopeptide (TPR) repeat protein